MGSHLLRMRRYVAGSTADASVLGVEIVASRIHIEHQSPNQSTNKHVESSTLKLSLETLVNEFLIHSKIS